MINNKYKISGMTCEACVQKVTEAVRKIPGVVSAEVSLGKQSIDTKSAGGTDIATVQKALDPFFKYQVSEWQDGHLEAGQEPVSLLKTYKPLILIFGYVFFVSFALQISQGHFDFHIFMNHIMAGFFIGLSFFKFLDLQKFAESFSSYDPIAQKFLVYGFVYPFLELLIGLLFISNRFLVIANVSTIIILSATTYGVWKSLKRKSKIQCACAGVGFNLPLSWVTIFENLIMIAMAFVSIEMTVPLK